jgi:allantoicase
VANSPAVTHVRLRIFPDGGVARLRVHGVVAPDLKRFAPGEALDLAAIENGGVVIAANDMFFGPKDNLVMPGRGSHMGDGWETRRRRGDGHDWVIVRLGAQGRLQRLIVDTCHFKGNYPDRCTIEGLSAPGIADGDVERIPATNWVKVLPEARLEGHKVHDFGVPDGPGRGPFTHVRLTIFPDGGVSRLRVLGSLA